MNPIFVTKPNTNLLGGISSNNSICCNIMCYNASSSYNRTTMNVNTRNNDRSISNPNITFNLNYQILSLERVILIINPRRVFDTGANGRKIVIILANQANCIGNYGIITDQYIRL